MSDLKLIRLYGQLSVLTGDWCDHECKARTCCDPDYCAEARRYALDRWGAELEGADGRLPFLTPDGHCIVPPHMRPLCTAHVCDRAYEGSEFAEAYFDLRDAIGELEC